VLLIPDRQARILDRIAPDSIGIIDPRRNALVDAIPLGTRPSALALGGGYLWVASVDDATLLEIDPRSHEIVKTIGLPTSVDWLATDGKTVWAIRGFTRRVIELDAGSGDVVRTLRLGNRWGNGPFRRTRLTAPTGVTAAADALWIASGYGVVERVDARSGAVTRLAAGSGGGVAFDGRNVWAVGGFFDATDPTLSFSMLSRIDPIRRRVTTWTQPPAFGLGRATGALAADGRGVWGISEGAHAVWRLDPERVGVTSVARLRPGPIGIAVGEGGAWSANDDGTVSRFDPASGALVNTIPLGRYPRVAYPIAIAVGDGDVWVAVR
jgi:DNA-binding beta-propeller fold protein YncE